MLRLRARGEFRRIFLRNKNTATFRNTPFETSSNYGAMIFIANKIFVSWILTYLKFHYFRVNFLVGQRSALKAREESRITKFHRERRFLFREKCRVEKLRQVSLVNSLDWTGIVSRKCRIIFFPRIMLRFFFSERLNFFSQPCFVFICRTGGEEPRFTGKNSREE